LLSVAIACVFNILGDLLLVAGFHMATAGAAIATVAAQLLSVILSLLIVSRQKLPFIIRKNDFCLDLDKIRDILRIGVPVALQDVLVNVSFLVLTAIVNSLGVVISAGVGVAEKLCGFVLLAPSAFSQTMTSVVAQNMGAEKPERAKKALMYGIASSFAVGVVASYFSFFHGDIMASIFSNDSAVIDAAAQYLKAYAIDTLLVSVMFCMSGYFTGCGRTTFAMLQGVIGAFCVRIPFSFIMSRRVPVNLFHIGLATPASSLLQTVLCVVYYWYLNRKKTRME
jgi:putative MATE family efflux protein